MVSEIHKEMTNAILEFSRQKYIRQKNREWMIMMDDSPHWHSPPNIEGYRPDLYIWSERYKVTIIGEAKTENDFMTPRSRNQISKFIDHLSGREGQSILILCVALNQVNNAQNLVESSKSGKKKITIHLIDRSKYDHFHA